MSSEAYIRGITDLFLEKGNPEIAQGQMAYMKHQFEFYGLKMPAWTVITKAYIQVHGYPSDVKSVALLCFEADQREIQYFALEIVQATLKKQDSSHIDLLESLIVQKSWWDSVDWIAKLVGIHFKRYPDLIIPVTERWMASGNMWLQRVSIIFQLSYRDQTNTDLMFKYILAVADSKEFFLQKAAGWALRQHTRTDPAAVVAFVKAHPLSALTRREALRLMATPVPSNTSELWKTTQNIRHPQ
jgi:3-methyladenine DNA glycosylase AlkD